MLVWKNPKLSEACIYQDYFSHIKWYSDGSRADKKQILWHFLRRLGRVATDEEWDKAMANAKDAANAMHEENMKRYQEKVIWAKNTPRPNGKPRKKPKVPQYPGKYNFLYEELEKVMKEQP